MTLTHSTASGLRATPGREAMVPSPRDSHGRPTQGAPYAEGGKLELGSGRPLTAGSLLRQDGRHRRPVLI